MNSVQIGIIGTGKLGEYHAGKATAHPNATLVGVFDPNLECCQRVAKKYRTEPFSTLQDLIDHTDAVIIAAPTVEHAPIARKVLLAGKHLLVEKPLCTRAEDAYALVELAEKQGVLLTVGHVEEFNPAWRAAIPIIQTMMQDSPIFLEGCRVSPYTFRCADVGAVLDIMIHDLEMVLRLFGSRLSYALRQSHFAPLVWKTAEFGEHEDTAAVSWKMDQGDKIQLFASRVEMAPKRTMTIRSRKKRITIDFAARTVSILSPDVSILEGAYSPQRINYPAIVPLVPSFMKDHYSEQVKSFPPFDALAEEMNHFIRAIRQETDLMVPGERAADAVVLAEKILSE